MSMHEDDYEPNNDDEIPQEEENENQIECNFPIPNTFDDGKLQQP